MLRHANTTSGGKSKYVADFWAIASISDSTLAVRVFAQPNLLGGHSRPFAPWSRSSEHTKRHANSVRQLNSSGATVN